MQYRNQRHFDAKCRACTKLGMQGQRMLQQLAQALHDRQTQAQPFTALPRGIFQLHKLLEYSRLILRGDACPAVADFDAQMISPLATAQQHRAMLRRIANVSATLFL